MVMELKSIHKSVGAMPVAHNIVAKGETVKKFRRILVPLDGSDQSEWALRPAFELAEAAQSELILLRSMAPAYTMKPVVAGEYVWSWPE
jgi:hypothetical protein